MLFDSHAHENQASYSPRSGRKLIKTIEASDVDDVADIGYDLRQFETGSGTRSQISVVLCRGRLPS